MLVSVCSCSNGIRPLCRQSGETNIELNTNESENLEVTGIFSADQLVRALADGPARRDRM